MVVNRHFSIAQLPLFWKKRGGSATPANKSLDASGGGVLRN
jgi:hypothetical protein